MRAPAAGATVRVALALLLAGGWTAAGAFYAALLPWPLGVWTDTEPMVLALHLAALFGALGLALGLAVRTRLFGDAVRHPAVLLAAMVALWSALASAFTPLPLLSLFGSPQLGEGALHFADAAVFLAVGVLASRIRPLYRALAWPCIGVCVVTPLVVAVAGARDAATPWWLFKFDDYLAWYAVAGVVLVLAGGRARFAVRMLLAMLVAAPGLVVSDNQTAIVVAAAGFAAAALAAVIARRPPRTVAWARVAAVCAVPLLAGAGLLAVWLIGDAGWERSLTSRLFMYRALLPVVMDDPAVLLFGQGWGQINTAILLHIADSGATIWDGSWDLSTRDIPHSHNLAVEALAGAGLPALLGVLAVVGAIPATAARRHLPAAAFAVLGVAGLGAMWFQLSATAGLVLIALGIAGGGGRRRAFRHRHAACRRAAGAFAALAILQAAAIFVLADYGIAAQRAVARDYRSADGGPCAAFPDDGWRGDVGLAQQFDDAFRAVFSTGETVAATARWEALLRLHCLVRSRAADGRSPRLMLADLLFRGQVASVPLTVKAAAQGRAALADWEPALWRFLAVAPGRTDVAVPYLAWRLQHGEADAVVRFAGRLVERYPDDPIGYWFLGAGLAGSAVSDDAARTQRVVSLMRRALVLGVARVIKVDPALIHFLEEHRVSPDQ